MNNKPPREDVLRIIESDISFEEKARQIESLIQCEKKRLLEALKPLANVAKYFQRPSDIKYAKQTWVWTHNHNGEYDGINLLDVYYAAKVFSDEQ